MPFDAKPTSQTQETAVLPVELRGLVFAVDGKRLIDDLSLRLEAGSRTVILGANGAGKSLTLRLMQGLVSPQAGEILWAGRPATSSTRRKVGLVFQRPVLLRRSVAANLRHALRVYGVPRRQIAGRIDDLLAIGGLGDLRDRPARVLSGGEQQRLSIIRAMAAEPELLLLDEPTASLDPHSTQAVEGLINKAHAIGTKVVLVTHDLGQARRLADDLVFIHRGRVTEHAPADGFFARPRSEAAQAYVEGRLFV